MRVAINGFGRVGRLALRAALGRIEGLEFVAVNEPHATAETMALLLEFDSVQGRFERACSGADGALRAGARKQARTGPARWA